MGIIDEVREIDEQISGQLQKSALAAEIARARGQHQPPSAALQGKVKVTEQARQKVAELISRVSRHTTPARHAASWMQPSPDAVAFIRRAYATPAFLGLMQDLADYDK